MKIGSRFVHCDNMYTTGYCTMYTWTQVTYINTKLCLLCPAYTAGLPRHYKRVAVGVSKVHDQWYLELAGDGEPVHHPTFKYAMPSLPRCQKQLLHSQYYKSVILLLTPVKNKASLLHNPGLHVTLVSRITIYRHTPHLQSEKLAAIASCMSASESLVSDNRDM